MQDILVTILVIVYNHEKYIDDCIKSILEQTYNNIEIIITDDCSTDNSFSKALEWKKELEARFKRVCIIQTPYNMGVVKNINNALSLVTGEYFKWIASDDMLMPSAIERMVATLRENPNYAMVYSNYYTCLEEDHYYEFISSKHEICRSPIITEQEQYAQALYENDFIIAPTTMVKWEVVQELNFFDENIGVEDWGSWIEIALNYEIGFLDEVTAMYRVVQNSLSRFTADAKGKTRLKNMLVNEIKILEKYKNHPKINEKPGIRSCCNQGISVAIDLKADELIDLVKKYAKDNGVELSAEMKLKYVFYRLHVLKGMQYMKKLLQKRG